MQPREEGLVSKKPVGTLGDEYLVESVPLSLMGLLQSLLKWENIKLYSEMV